MSRSSRGGKRTFPSGALFLAGTCLVLGCGGGGEGSIQPLSLTWTQLAAPSKPCGRYYTALAYDAQSWRTILFGGNMPLYDAIESGFLPTTFPLNDTWAFDGAAKRWMKREPAGSPPARSGHAMVYDSANDRVILFGGGSDQGALNDTWAYDYETDSWTNLEPAQSPPATSQPALAYDIQSDAVILFLDGATWAYRYTANTWTQKASNPDTTKGVLVYRPTGDRVILVNGEENTKVWTYDYEGDTWASFSPTLPLPYRGHASFGFAFDAQSDRVILFGGVNQSGQYTREVWALDVAGGTWENKGGFTELPTLARLSLAYDAGIDRTLLFGGVGVGIRFSETWAYDYDANTWGEFTDQTRPPERYGHAMAYDSIRRKIVLFGGQSPNAFHGFGTAGLRMDDTWTYDVETGVWTKQSPSQKPPPRDRHGMAYDAESDRVLLIGGETPNGVFLKDVWAYEVGDNSWTQRADMPFLPSLRPLPVLYDGRRDRTVVFTDQGLWSYDYNADTWNQWTVGGPTSRHGTRMVYDVESDRYVLFGGYTGDHAAPSRLSDTWAYDPTSQAWSLMDPPASPPGRYAFGMAYHPGIDRVVLFGGSIGTDLLTDDAWVYDFNTNRWETLVLEPRPKAAVWTDLCYVGGDPSLLLFSGFTIDEGLIDPVWKLAP